MFGRHNIEIGDFLAWVAGPIDLALNRERGELRISKNEVRSPTSKEVSPHSNLSKVDVHPAFSTTRFSMPSQDPVAIDIQPISHLRHSSTESPSYSSQEYYACVREHSVWIGSVNNRLLFS